MFSRSVFFRSIFTTVMIFLMPPLGSKPVESKEKVYSGEFLAKGKPIDELSPWMSESEIRDYRDAVNRLGDEKCRLRDDVSVGSDDFSLDWSKVDSLKDIEVCAFFAAVEIRSRKEISAYLLRSGFNKVYEFSSPSVVAKFSGISGTSYTIGAAYEIEDLPFGFGYLTEIWFAYNLSIGITVDEQGRPYDVRAVLNRE